MKHTGDPIAAYAKNFSREMWPAEVAAVSEEDEAHFPPVGVEGGFGSGPMMGARTTPSRKPRRQTHHQHDDRERIPGSAGLGTRVSRQLMTSVGRERVRPVRRSERDWRSSGDHANANALRFSNRGDEEGSRRFERGLPTLSMWANLDVSSVCSVLRGKYD